MEYLIIDGYNIINSWTDVFSPKDTLEQQRDKLLEIFANYQGYKKNNIIIVFDAHMVKGNVGSVEKHGKIEVVYTKENESADHYIERFVHQMPGCFNVTVATSDYLQQIIVMNGGGIRMSARELKEEVKRVNKRIREQIEKKQAKANDLESRLPDNIRERLEKMRRDKF